MIMKGAFGVFCAFCPHLVCFGLKHKFFFFFFFNFSLAYIAK